MFILIVLSFVFNLFPMVILPVFYEVIPNNVPAFLDFFGNTVVAMEKSYISILRVPFMGLLLSILCAIMYRINLSEENIKNNKIIWSVASLICSLKMGITSMEILFFENTELVHIFRILIMVLVITGILVLIYGLIKMYKNKIPIQEYKTGVKNNSIKIIGILCLYIIVVLMPMYIK